MFPKEILWIGAKGGLLEERHYYAMRDAVWLFLWLLLRQTSVSESGEGVVSYGHPITKATIVEDTGFNDWRIERWISRLRRTRYIRTQQIGREGLIFWILAGKEKTKKSQISHRALPAKTPEVKASPPAKTPEVGKNAGNQVSESEAVKADSGSPIPKDLSYYNTTAAAQPAAVPSLSSIAKSKKIPRLQKSDAEMRTELEKQKAVLKAKGFLQ